jgi:uncharacterized protein (TIGR00106 family)
MKVVADFCVIPLGVGVSVSKYVAECVMILEARGLKVRTHAYGSNIEGDWDEVFTALKFCHEALHDMGAPRISTTVKVGSRTDAEQSIDGKIDKVNRLLKDGKKKSRKKGQPKATTSPYCRVKKSSIHNKGIVAKKFIPEGTQVIEYVGEKVTKKRADEIYEQSLRDHQKDSSKGAVYLFVLNSRYDINGNVSWNTARYINHSCEPNCETDIIDDKIWIIATRDIEAGEELSYDYGYDLENWEDHPCRCGAKNCVGYIVADEHRDKLKRILKKRKEKKKKSLSGK